jgi:hypothetical protein
VEEQAVIVVVLKDGHVWRSKFPLRGDTANERVGSLAERVRDANEDQPLNFGELWFRPSTFVAAWTTPPSASDAGVDAAARASGQDA